MANPFDLSGRVAVVTGGNGGIGLGMAEALAAAGCAVSVWGRNTEKNRTAVATLTALGAKAEAQACDVADRASVDAAFAATLSAFGRVDGLFANAGITGSSKGPFIDRPFDDFQRVMAANVAGVAHCFQVAARHMTERAKAGDAFGRLIATSSVASIEGAAHNEHYGASKGAVNAMVRALAVELARYGVTANTILPGWIETDMTTRTLANEKFVNAVAPRIPVRRFGQPADLQSAPFAARDIPPSQTRWIWPRGVARLIGTPPCPVNRQTNAEAGRACATIAKARPPWDEDA